MRIFLIRHAQSYNNLPETENRLHEPGITELGIRQLEALSNYLSQRLNPHAVHLKNDFANKEGFYFTKLYTSPMYRSLQSAQYLAPPLRLIPEIWVELHEEGGIWLEDNAKPLLGLTSNEINQEFPNFILDKKITEIGWWNRYKESLDDANLRAHRVANQLSSQLSSKEQVVLITHSGFIDKLIKVLLKQPLTNEILHVTQNTSITRIDLTEKQIKLCYLNKTEHLNKELDSE